VLEACDRVNPPGRRISFDRRTADTTPEELTDFVASEHRAALQARHARRATG
jgi:hypothetical protein